MRGRYLRELLSCVVFFMSASCFTNPILGQDDGQKEKQLAARFQKLLERNPRRGTALDRVYGYHAESGTLDELIDGYKKRTAVSPTDGKAWFIQGLLEAKRGNDAEAVKALQQAEKHDPENALASYYLGQTLILAGQGKEATVAMERAIKKRPTRTDLLEMYQSLGRIHQRAHRTDEALAVWGRLEEQFPGDQRVAEQIATALAEEDQFAEALKRYQKLAGKTDDDLYRRVIYQIEAANMTLRLGNKDDAVQQFERLLGQLKPDGWLHQQVRGKIEGIFRQADDLAGLASYYESWLGKHQDDLGAMSRLATTLASLGRGEEARKWFDKAIQLAPTRIDLRQALIDQLVYEKKYTDAVAQYEKLDQVDRGNPDHIRQWGLLLLRDKTLDQQAQREKAAEVWMRLVTARPKDAVMATQVADLLRQAEVFDRCEQLYKKAVELKPNEVQYREYLGEFYHDRDRKDEALAAWKEMARGPRRNAENLHRLAEVLSGFSYLKPAIEAAKSACDLEKTDFNMHITLVDLLSDDSQHNACLAILGRMDGFTENLEEKEAVLDRRINAYMGAEILDEKIKAMQELLAVESQATSEGWRHLARFLEAQRLQAEAIVAANKAIQLNDKSIAAYRLIARLQENTGDMAAASAANRKLAVIDSRFKTNYLTEVARLESRLGRVDEALRAGRDLIAAAPGNPEHYHFFADLCFQLGQNEEGLKTLRRAVRSNPSDYEQLLKLGAALSGQFRVPEAIELYWRAFEKADDLNDKVRIISQLADLYLQQNQFDTLLTRLERLRRESKADRVFAFCVAGAHLRAQDFGAARGELSVFLAQNDRDTHLLEQIGSIAEQESDYEAAIKYQMQLVKLAPTDQRRRKLAQLFLKSDQLEDAERLMAEMALEQEKLEQIYKSVDELTVYDRLDGAKTITTQLVRNNPRSWEALYRDGTVLAKMGKKDEARKRFEQLLALDFSHDDKSAQQKAADERAKKQKKGQSAYASLQPWMSNQGSGILSRTQNSYAIRQAVGLQADRRYYSPGTMRRAWAPNDYGTARMASIGWLYRMAGSDSKSKKAFEENYAANLEANDKKEVDSTEKAKLLDSLYFAALQQKMPVQYQLAKRLSFDGTVDSQILYLQMLGYRTGNQGRNPNSQQKDTTPPLSNEEMDHVLACYNHARKNNPEGSSHLLGTLLTELKRAQREDLEKKIYADAIAEADDYQGALRMAAVAASRGDMDQFIQFVQQIEKTLDREKTRQRLPSQSLNHTAMQLMWSRVKDESYDDVVKLLDTFEQLCLTEQAIIDSRNRRGSSANYSSRNSYVQIYNPSGMQYIQSGFPGPVKELNQQLFSTLRNAFEIYKKADLLSDLTKHLQTGLQQLPPNQKVTRSLELAYCYWWDEKIEEALELIETAAQSSGASMEMKFMLADAYAELDDSERAIETLDSVTALDRKTIQDREQKILNLAVRVGYVERAREAAERLFGGRMNAAQQVTLAQQMHQLGLHDLGEAVLRRARRRSGGNRDHMLSVMSSYQQQGQMDIAVQVAHQILRRGRQPNSNGRDSVRDQALRVLSQSGKLKDLIARAEKQLQQSPKSPKLVRNLADYYQAGRQTEKAQEMYRQLAEITPDNARMRYELAEMLRQAGEKKEAIEQYLIALKQDVGVFNRNYWQIQRFFDQNKKKRELLEIFANADLTKTRDPWQIMNVLDSGQNDKKNVDLEMKIFTKLWEAFPDYRSSLMSNISRRTELMKELDLYEYASSTFLDSNINYGYVTSGWQAMSNIHSWGTDSVQSSAGMLLDVAKEQNKFDELRQSVRKKLETDSGWTSGKALLALIDLRENKTEEATQQLQKLLFDKDEPISGYAAMVVGHELKNHKALQPMLLSLYENCMDDQQIQNSGLGFRYGVGGRLVKLYKDAGRKADAINLIKKAAQQPIGQQYDPQYAAYQWLERQTSLGNELLSLDEPLQALRIFRDAESQPQRVQTATQWGGSYYRDQFDNGMKKAKTLVTSKMILEDLIAKPLGSTDEDNSAQVNDGKSPQFKQPAIDFMTYVQASGDDKGTLKSPILEAISDLAPDAELLKQVREKVGEMIKSEVDLSVFIARVLLELKNGDADSQTAAFQSLSDFLKKETLDELGKKERANARQRRQAEQQIIVWFAAEACLNQNADPSFTQQFADRAIRAAERQIEKGRAAAMLQRMGQAMIEIGDRDKARQYWQRMLELLIDRPLSEPPRAAAASTDRFRWLASVGMQNSWGAGLIKTAHLSLQSQVAALASPAPASSTKKRRFKKGVRPVTKEAFPKIVDLSRLAAKNDMHDLSLQCIWEALRTGPPIVVQPSNHNSASGFVSVATSSSSSSSTQNVDQIEVFSAIAELVDLWTDQNIDNAKVYDVLAEVVFPAQRKGEIFLYAEPIQLPNKIDVGSVGLRLVRAAIEAGKTEELKKRLASRSEMPLAKLPAKVLATYLGIETRDAELTQKSIDWFIERLKQDTQPNTVQVACLAGLRAFVHEPLRENATKLLEHASQGSAANPNDQFGHNVQLMLARVDRKSGRKQMASNRLKELGKSAISSLAGNTSTSSVRRKLIEIGQEQGKFGNLDETLDFLGRISDLPQNSRSDTAPLVTYGLRMLNELSAEDRYAKILAWMMPTEQRRSIRTSSTFLYQRLADDRFYTTNNRRPVGDSFGSRFGSFAEILIRDAAALDRMDELAGKLQPLVDENVEFADTLLLLTQIASDDPAARGKIITEAGKIKSNSLNRSNNRQQVPWSDYLLVRACLRSEAHEPMGVNLVDRLIEHSIHQVQGHMLRNARYDAAAFRLEKVGQSEDELRKPPRFKHWQTSGFQNAHISVGNVMPDLWFESDGMVSTAAGSDHPYLFWKYPLEGDFEFSADIYDGGWGEGQIAYGGIQIDAQNWDNAYEINSPGNVEVARLFWTPFRRGDFNRWTIQSKDGKVRYLCNGHTLCELARDDLANPFLALATGGGRNTFFHNPELKGQPSIPREVPLLDGNKMEGWIPTFYNERRAQRWGGHSGSSQRRSDTPFVFLNHQVQSNVIWFAKDGTLIGKRRTSAGSNSPSLLFYYRPLMDGESIEYEFYYQPNSSMVHPCLDRLALLIGEKGVQLHWLRDNNAKSHAEVEDDNRVPVQVANQPVLKPAAWNLAKMSLQGNKITLALNGRKLTVVELPDDNNRLFGFYRHKDKFESQIRKIVLRGDWPEQISAEMTSDLFVRMDQRTPELHQAHTSIIGERTFSLVVAEVYQRALTLQPEARYQFLREWVLPSDSHTGLRLYGTFPQRDPANQQSPQRFAPQSPALLLVETAPELNKLSELLQDLGSFKPESRNDRRALTAMKLIVAVHQDAYNVAISEAKSLKELSSKVALQTSLHNRWAEILALHVAAESNNQKLKTIARQIAQQLRRETIRMRDKNIAFFNEVRGPGNPFPERTAWTKYVHRMVGQLTKVGQYSLKDQNLSTSWGSDWHTVSHANCSVAGLGIPSGGWIVRGDEVFHATNVRHDAIYYKKPLGGNFTFDCELKGLGNGQLRVSYGGLSFGLSGDGKTLEIRKFDRIAKDVDLKKAVTLTRQGWYPVQLSVSDRQLKLTMDGNTVFTRKLPWEVDPWLYLYAQENSRGGVRNCRVVSSGDERTDFAISGFKDLAGWLLYYDDSVLRGSTEWVLEGDEFRGRLAKQELTNNTTGSQQNELSKAAPKGSFQEHWLKYHRPLLEDAEIAYEFYYDKDMASAHPSIGRMAMMLHPDGARIHWITDAQWDPSGLSPSNLESVDSQKIELKEKDWNQVNVRLVGNKVKLTVNGKDVFEKEITETRRDFGIFHFADQSEARVKNVRLKIPSQDDVGSS